jgi:hypothetical protein
MTALILRGLVYYKRGERTRRPVEVAAKQKGEPLAEVPLLRQNNRDNAANIEASECSVHPEPKW